MKRESTTSGTPLHSLHLTDLRVRYRAFELKVPELRLDPGVTLLAGPNGAGKTTLLRAVAGTVRTAEGTVSLGGAAMRPDGVGVLPQRPSLPRDLSVQRTVEHVLWLRGSSPTDARSRAAALLEEFELESHGRRPCRELSGGMSRRLSICCAVAASPTVVLLDEPTNDLDPIQRSSVLEMIARLGKEHIVVVSSHALTEVSGIADGVVLLNRGRIIFDGDLPSLAGKYGPPDDTGVEGLYVRAIVVDDGAGSRT